MAVTVKPAENDPIFIVHLKPPFADPERELTQLLEDLRCWVKKNDGFGYVILNVGDELLAFSTLIRGLRNVPEADRTFFQRRVAIIIVGSQAVITMAQDSSDYTPALGSATFTTTMDEAIARARQNIRVTTARVPHRTAS